jgi:hypothetical protein
MIVVINAAKPVLIDDTAYLSFARQIARHPFDPYGFTFFWYTTPDNAFEILCPPVVPYWLAAGITVVGENPGLLKLWLYPFIWILMLALREILRRFAGGIERPFLLMLALSPAILPTVNLMLDVPALALGLAALTLLIRSCDRHSWRLSILAGLVAGLAMQTKYTALLIPPTLLWYGLTRWRLRSLGQAVLAILLALATFASWELLLVARYERSHFLFHVRDRQSHVETSAGFLAEFVQDKMQLVPALLGDLGCLGFTTGVIAATLLGLPRRYLTLLILLWSLGFCWIALTPARLSALPVDGPDTSVLVNLFWQSAGFCVLLAWLSCSVPLLVRFRSRLSIRLRADSLFLLGWLLIELAGYLILTPFGAARRVITLVMVSGLVTAFLAKRIGRIHAGRAPSGWLFGLGILTGVVVTAIDTLDAFPEKVCAEHASALTANEARHSTVWFAGHWGFQYYCTQAGMRHIEPGSSVLLKDDVLVLPLYPDEVGFYRPHIGLIALSPPASSVMEIAEVIWEDFLSATTIPNFYCGVDPIRGRDHPRLRVVIYRMTEEWKVPGR